MKKAKFVRKKDDKFYTFEVLEDPYEGEIIDFGIDHCKDDYKEELTELVPQQEVWISYFLAGERDFHLIHLLTEEPSDGEEIYYDLALDSRRWEFQIESIRTKEIPEIRMKVNSIIRVINKLSNKKETNYLTKNTNILILIVLIVIIAYLLIKN